MDISVPASLTQQPDSIERAILETLAYSDIFEYPLTLKELHRYLPLHLTERDLVQTMKSLDGVVQWKDDYYFLAGRDEIVDIRRGREARSRPLMPAALKYGRILGSMPFIRMVALTGSLAVLNVSKNADFDYMLVTAPGRVWTARAFALLVGRMTRALGYTLCPNLIVSENALAWPLHDLYSARELVQMIPIIGMDVYQKVMKANEWAREILPNSFLESNSLLFENVQKRASAIQNLLELPLCGKPGDSFERWEMTRKIARFSKQAGFGEETVFTEDVCQGNFHHHRKWTRDAFQERLNNLSADAPLLSGEGQGVRAS